MERDGVKRKRAESEVERTERKRRESREKKEIGIPSLQVHSGIPKLKGYFLLSSQMVKHGYG